MQSLVKDTVLPQLPNGADARGLAAHQRSLERERSEVIRLCLTGESDALFTYLQNVSRDGVSIRDICEFVLAPAANQLGEMWEEDEVNFLQVTEAVGMLASAVHRISHHETADRPSVVRQRKVLIITPRGEAHVFGAMVVGTLLRLENFDVAYLPEATPQGAADYVVHHGIGMIGISAHDANHTLAVERIIEAVRGRVGRERCPIMVGGGIYRHTDGTSLPTKADAIAESGQDAIALALQFDAH